MADISENLPQLTNFSALMPDLDPQAALLKSANLQNVQSNTNLQNAQAQQAGAVANMQQFQLQRQQQYYPMLQQVLQNPTPSNFAALTAMFPDQHQAITSSYDMSRTGQQQAVIEPMSRAYAAMLNGRPDIATQIVQQQHDALVNSGGDPNDPQFQDKLRHADVLLDTIQNNPKAAMGLMGATLSSVLGPQGFPEHFSAFMAVPATVGKANADAATAAAAAAVAPAAAVAGVAKTQADTQNVLDQIRNRVASFGLEQDKYQTDTAIRMAQLRYQTQFPNLPAAAQGTIADSVGQAQQAQMSADRAQGIAQRIQNDPNYGSGMGARANAAYQDFMGNQDQTNNLRKEYTQLRTSAIFSQIQNGRTTDNDLKVINQGFPDANANPQQIATFLNSYANIQRRMAVYQDARADWVSQVGSLGRAPQDITVQGVKVPKGTMFNDYMLRGAPKAMPSVTPPNAAPGQDLPSYMSYGQ